MATSTRMRSYSKKNISKNSSLDVVNALFAQNIGHRKQAKTRRKINIRELPPPDPNVQLSDNSLKIEINNTFDKIKEGSVYKPVALKNSGINNFSTESDTSKSRSKIPQISFSHIVNSPVIKRKRKKRLKSSVKITDLLPEIKKQKQEDTLDKPVLSSLEVEKATLSINSPNEIFSLRNGSNSSNVLEVKITDLSYEPFFTNTFRDRVLAVSKICSTPNVSSTPQIPLKRHDIVSEISPIPSKKPEKVLSHDVLKASYQEIEKWDLKYPIESTPFSKKYSTPKRSFLPRRSNRIMSVLSVRSSGHEKENWFKNDPKLQMKPYIALYNIPGIQNKLVLKSTENEQKSSISTYSCAHNNLKVSFTNTKSNTQDFVGFTKHDLQYSAKRSFALDNSVTTEICHQFDAIWQPHVIISRLSDEVLQNYKFKRRTRSLSSLRNISDNTDHKINEVPVVWLSRLNLTQMYTFEKKTAENCTFDYSKKDVSTELIHTTSRSFSQHFRHSVASDCSRHIINEYLKGSRLIDISK